MAHIATNDNRAYTILNNYLFDTLGVNPNRIDSQSDYFADATINYDSTKQYTTGRCIKITNAEYIVYVTKQHRPYIQQYLYQSDIDALFPVIT